MAPWVTPLLTDAGVRRDTARFMRGIHPADPVDVSTRLGRFTRPVLLLWGTGDRFFPCRASEISTFLVPA